MTYIPSTCVAIPVTLPPGCAKLADFEQQSARRLQAPRPPNLVECVQPGGVTSACYICVKLVEIRRLTVHYEPDCVPQPNPARKI
jgi:hypothetical protein